MRILMLAPNYIKRTNWGHQLWRNEIAAQNDVVFHGDGHELHGVTNVSDLVAEHGPFDVITVGENPRHFDRYEQIDTWSKMVKVGFVCDYFDGKERNYNRLINKHKCDVVFLPSQDCLRRFWATQKAGGIAPQVEAHWLPWSVDTNIYYKQQVEKEYDVMAVFGLVDSVYPNRTKIQKMLRELPYKSLLGNWTEGNVKQKRYVEAINKSKIFVSANGVHRELTMKYTECLACGTMFLTDRPRDFEVMGFIDGEHMVLYDGLEDMTQKLAYYLSHDAEREKIAWTGMEYVRKNFSNELWVKEWTTIVEELIWQKNQYS